MGLRQVVEVPLQLTLLSQVGGWDRLRCCCCFFVIEKHTFSWEKNWPPSVPIWFVPPKMNLTARLDWLEKKELAKIVCLFIGSLKHSNKIRKGWRHPLESVTTDDSAPWHWKDDEVPQLQAFNSFLYNALTVLNSSALWLKLWLCFTYLWS